MSNEKPVPQIKDVVMIAHDLHAKTPEALEALLAHLSEDYDIKNCMDDKDHPHRGWYARLKPEVHSQKAKCSYCNHLNDMTGCKVHGFTCKGCNKVIYRKYLHGAPVEFYIRADRDQFKLRFLIHSYDSDTKMLYVYAKPMKNERSFFGASPAKAEQILAQNPEAYERVTGAKGVKLLKFYCPPGFWMDDSQKINLADVGHAPGKHKKDENGEWIMEGTHYKYLKSFYDETNSKQFYHEVQVLKGQEIEGGSDWDLPVYASFMIYDTYKTSPAPRDKNLSRKIIQEARQVADCGYYYQDGSVAFYPGQLEWMSRYVEHFTDLDVKEFNKFVKLADKSGPGFIQDLAFWVEEQTGIAQWVENKPNICNVINAMSNLGKYGRLSYRESKALSDGLADQEICQDYCDLMGNVARHERVNKKKKK